MPSRKKDPELDHTLAKNQKSFPTVISSQISPLQRDHAIHPAMKAHKGLGSTTDVPSPTSLQSLHA